jgi:hypothetical protein
MLIPKNHDLREAFYDDLVQKCFVSIKEREARNGYLRSYYLRGASPDAPQAMFNKIFPSIDALTAFLYAAETTQFSVVIGSSVENSEAKKIPALSSALNDSWHDSNIDLVFSEALNWSLVYSSTFIKLIWKNGIRAYMVEPHTMGVLREDVPYLSQQQAVCNRYWITKSELEYRIKDLPRRKEILDRITDGRKEQSDMPSGVQRIILSSSHPNMSGSSIAPLHDFDQYSPKMAEDLVEMYELYVWNDEIADYQMVTVADPGVVIYDRQNTFLIGELPFVQVCPNPLYNYFWGMSEVSLLAGLQDWRTKRMQQISELLDKQVNPPHSFIGASQVPDEMMRILNRPGGLFMSNDPMAKVEEFKPVIPADTFTEIGAIDEMFIEILSLQNVMMGKGEVGVRSKGHASELARLGSSRAKKRALIIEDSLEQLASLYLKMLQVYSDIRYIDEDGVPFTAEQFTKDYMVKVDAHSNSPLFVEDLKQTAVDLFKAKAIDRRTLIEIMRPPMMQVMLERLVVIEEKEAKAEQAKRQAEAVKGNQ